MGIKSSISIGGGGVVVVTPVGVVIEASVLVAVAYT